MVQLQGKQRIHGAPEGADADQARSGRPMDKFLKKMEKRRVLFARRPIKSFSRDHGHPEARSPHAD